MPRARDPQILRFSGSSFRRSLHLRPGRFLLNIDQADTSIQFSRYSCVIFFQFQSLIDPISDSKLPDLSPFSTYYAQDHTPVTHAAPMSMSIVSSAKSVARRLKYQSNLISKLEARATTQNLVIQYLISDLVLLCQSLSTSNTGPDGSPVPQEACDKNTRVRRGSRMAPPPV